MELTKLDKKQLVWPLIYSGLGVLLGIWDIIGIAINLVNGEPLKALLYVVLLALAVYIVFVGLSMPWTTLKQKILAEHEAKLEAVALIANSANWYDPEFYGREIVPRFDELDSLLRAPNWPNVKFLQPFDFKNRVNR